MNDDEPRWLTTLYWASWGVLWLVVAVVMLACVFGLVLTNWRG